MQQLPLKQPPDDSDPKCDKEPDQITSRYSTGVEEIMFTATLLIAMVLPALMLGHMAHEELQSQLAYRRARSSPRH